MIYLASTHTDILRKYVDQAERILDPKGEFKAKDELRQRNGAKAESTMPDTDKERELTYRRFKQKAEEAPVAAAGAGERRVRPLRC